jgi:serine phosphatase RsbU (regulator of sigma subunit)/CBS domain-containing protein
MADQGLRVRDLMQPDPILVEPDRCLRDVVRVMNQHRIGAVGVVTAERELLGIFSERDLLRRISDAEPDWGDWPVARWMTTNPHTVGPDLDWEGVTALMDRLRVRHLPVVEHGRVIGIISSRMLLGHRTRYLDQQVERRTRQLKQANDELLARDAELRSHLRAAGRLQARLLLPHSPPPWPELRWGVHYSPLDHLGGDYYDTALPDEDHLGFLIADASGHSVAAGMVAIMSRIAFSEVSGRTISPGEVLTEMNQRLQGLADERFVTAFYGVLHRRSRILTYANAGHPYPLRWIAATGKVEPIAAQGFMLGIMPGEQYRERSIELQPGDRLCFYTDGLVEARNEIGETFGMDRLFTSVAQHGSHPAAVLMDNILRDLRQFQGTHPLTDDLTVVVAELCGNQ